MIVGPIDFRPLFYAGLVLGAIAGAALVGVVVLVCVVAR